MTDLDVEIYKEAISANMKIFEGVIKITGLTFTCNAVLLAALSFIIGGESSSDFSYLISLFYVATTVFGIVFNLGIFFFYIRISRAWITLYREVVNFETNHFTDDKIKILETIEPNPSRFGATNILTTVFYVTVILVWISAALSPPTFAH